MYPNLLQLLPSTAVTPLSDQDRVRRTGRKSHGQTSIHLDTQDVCASRCSFQVLEDVSYLSRQALTAAAPSRGKKKNNKNWLANWNENLMLKISVSPVNLLIYR